MSVNPIDLTGGKSVYCFNQNQLDRAVALSKENSPAGERVRATVSKLEYECSRNEQAAIAFILLQRLNATAG